MLVIDCYNVLHADMPPELAGLTEAGLCVALGGVGWASAGGGGVKVVVDGGATVNSPLAEEVHPIEVVYSGHAATADDVIVRLIDSSTAPRRLTVVSSDRVIREAAKRRRARSLTSERFIDRLTAAVRSPRAASPAPGFASRKQAGPLTTDTTRYWLRVFGFDPQRDAGMADPTRLGTPDARPWCPEDDEHWPP